MFSAKRPSVICDLFRSSRAAWIPVCAGMNGIFCEPWTKLLRRP